MPKVRINGTLAPVSKPNEVDFDPVRGLIVHSPYESAGRGLGGLANTFLNAGIAFRWVDSPVKSTLDATYSGGSGGLPDNPQQSWQLLANEGQLDILEGSLALSVEASFPGTIQAIKAAASALESGDLDTVNSITGTVNAGALNTFGTLLGLIARGTTHFAKGQYALKRTVSISYFFVGNVSFPFLNEVFSETLIPPVAMFNLGIPSQLSTIIAGIPAPAFQSGYFWSWRQLPSCAVIGAYNRTEVSTEWWLDNWSTSLYGIA